MQKVDAVAWAGGIRELAGRLGVSYQAVNSWPEEVPEGRQEELFILSKGALVPSALVVRRMKMSRAIPLPR